MLWCEKDETKEWQEQKRTASGGGRVSGVAAAGLNYGNDHLMAGCNYGNDHLMAGCNYGNDHLMAGCNYGNDHLMAGCNYTMVTIT
jgi:hypothetical protein